MGNLWNKASDLGDKITSNFANPLATITGHNHDSSNFFDHLNYQLSNPLKNAVQPAWHDAVNGAGQTAQWLGFKPPDPAPAPTMPANFLKYTGGGTGVRPGPGYTTGGAPATNGLATPTTATNGLASLPPTTAPTTQNALAQQPNWAQIIGRALM